VASEAAGAGAPLRFPDDFMWGAATSAHQVEGGNRWNDWWAAEQAGRLPHASGEACRHFELFERDFDLARDLCHNAHRFSIEWSRIEPEEGVWDEAALDHYREVVRALRRRGMEPLVTLHHFTNPLWLAQKGGWLNAETPERFARFVDKVAAALKDEVRWWVSVNEPTVYAKNAMVSGLWPPFRRGGWGAAFRTVRTMTRAHAQAYAVLHRHRDDAMVGMAHSAPYIEPRHPATAMDRMAARVRDGMLNRLPLYLLTRTEGGTFDFIGLNYYCRTLVYWSMRGRGLLFGSDWLANDQGEPRRYSDLGWEIHPPGFKEQLRAFARYDKQIVVTENGIATEDETLREDYLRSHLAMLAEAVAEGVPVSGYFYWSLFDNVEWAEGTGPRFGLARTDYTTQTRTPRPAAAFYAKVCRSGTYPPAADPPGAVPADTADG